MVTDRLLRSHRSGQALVELAIGMIAVSLVLAGVFGFTHYIIESMNAQRTLRSDAGRGALTGTGGDESYSSSSISTTITVSPMAADYIFGSTQVEVKEEVHLPLTGIQQQ